MSFLSKRGSDRHVQTVRIEGACAAEDSADGFPVAHVRFDNWNGSTFLPIADVASFRTASDPAAGSIHLRPYAEGAPLGVGGMQVGSSGRVGINVTGEPMYDLDVDGSIGCRVLYSDALVNGYVRAGAQVPHTGFDLDVAGDIRARSVLARHYIASASAGVPYTPGPLSAYPGRDVSSTSDVSVAGSDTEGIISLVYQAQEEGVQHSGDAPLVHLATVVFDVPLPSFVTVGAHDEAAASLEFAAYAIPRPYGFDLAASRMVVPRLAPGSLYRWAYVSARIPSPPYPSQLVPPTPAQRWTAGPSVSPGPDLGSAAAVNVLGTDSVGIVRVTMGAEAPAADQPPRNASHLATVHFMAPVSVEDATITTVLVTPWNYPTVSVLAGSGLRRCSLDSCASVLEDGSGFELFARIDARYFTPYATYTWAYVISVSDPGSVASASATVHPQSVGDSAVAECEAHSNGRGTITLLTGDPPVAEQASDQAVPFVSVRDVAGVTSASSIVVLPANREAASIARLTAALPSENAGFDFMVSTTPPQTPFWPHTMYRWVFCIQGVPHAPPLYPSVAFGPALGSGGAVRVLGNDVAGRVDVMFGVAQGIEPSDPDETVNDTDGTWWGALAANSDHIASVLFARRCQNTPIVQTTCARSPNDATTLPGLVIESGKGGWGFDMYMKSIDRLAIRPFRVYTWNYSSIAIS